MSAARCHHCHGAIDPGLEIGTAEKRFCCHACQAVASWIEAEAPQYYQLRTAAAPKASASPGAAHWQAYDAVAEHYVHRGEDGTKEIHLYIDGIHCAACSWLIRAALKKQCQIEDVRVNVGTLRAEIRWHNEALLSQILQCIADLGYQPDVYRPEQSEQRFHRQRNQALLRLIVAGLGSMQVMMFATGSYFGMDVGQRNFEQYLRWIGALCATPILFYSAAPFFRSAYASLKIKRMNMDVPVVLALLGAYVASLYHTVLGRGEVYFDSVTMFVFFLSLSRFIELLSRRRARLNEYRFAKLLPEVVELSDGRMIPLMALRRGEDIQVRAGATIPVDGEVLAGESRVDESMLHGESLPVWKAPGSAVLAGSHNLQSPLRLRVQRTGQDTVLAGLKRLIARAEQQRAPQLERHQRLAEWTVLGVLILAIAAYLLWQWIEAERAFEIALAVLVATCPCALSLATPTALTAAINWAHAQGILIKDSHTLQRLLDVRRLVFDKTGTLTGGEFRLLQAECFAEEALCWSLAKSLEQHSNHPLAWFFQRRPEALLSLENIQQHVGLGVQGSWQGEALFIGGDAFLQKIGLHPPPPPAEGSRIYLFSRQKIWAQFLLADPLQPEARPTLERLRPHYALSLASGDRRRSVEAVAQALRIEDYAAELSPEQKLYFLEARQPEQCLMVGDGSNDAPVLARAAVSVAVRRASALSQSHADIVLLQHGIEALPLLFSLAQRTQAIIRQNLAWATAYNGLILPLAVAGYLTPWLAALGMSLSSLLVVLNALRLQRSPRPAS